MSYTSKYTGEEIDELLDKVGSVNATTTVLWEGDVSAIGDGMTLSESLENFDYLLIEPYYISYQTKYRYGQVVCLSTERIKNNYGDMVIYPILTLYDSDSWSIALYVKFVDSKNLSISNKVLQHYDGAGINKIIGMKFNTSASITSEVSPANPIGSILPVMGTEAPQDYLVCDGSELNIVEYNALANYFEKQFGSKNYFGGDGETTFAVPDLRNEFLRGYGDLSGEIGEHQDATKHINTYGNAYGKGLAFGNATDDLTKAQNTDTVESFTYGYVQLTGTKYSDVNPDAYYTSRPTNVAVLFCIKYTESAVASASGSSYREVELLNAYADFPMKSGATVLNQELILNDDITNYDQIVFEINFMGTYINMVQNTFLVSGITYDTSDNYVNALSTCSSFSIGTAWNGGVTVSMTALVYFKNGTTLAIGYTGLTGDTSYNTFRIRSIKGIKY